MNNQLKDAMKAALKEVRNTITFTEPWFAEKFLVNGPNHPAYGWQVRAERQYPLPARPGPAWYIHYYLISPTGKRFGGHGDQRSFLSTFTNPNCWQWVDDYRGNGYGKAVAK